jgi:hypothetical protein
MDFSLMLLGLVALRFPFNAAKVPLARVGRPDALRGRRAGERWPEPASGALAELRAAEAVWRELEARYEEARTRVLVGRACGELGDGSEAELSLAAAAAVFEQLGAGPELGRVEQMQGAARLGRVEA